MDIRRKEGEMKMLHRFSGLLNRLRLPGCIVIFLSFSLSSLLFSGLSYGQDRGIEKNVGKVEKEAAGLFREGDFVKALPLYSQLLSLDPKNPDLNYHFGVCLLQGDRRDMERPLKFLEKAVKDPAVEAEAFFYLGLAYHFNYRFAEAISQFDHYKTVADAKMLKELNVDRQIEMCRNGFELLSNVSDIYVLAKSEVNQSDFYRAYQLKDFGGEFLYKPDIFKSKADKKRNDKTVVFFPKVLDEVFFSSYGDDQKAGRDIFHAYREADGSWGKPIRLKGAVNSVYDEDFPYLLPDGKTLYFCSKGHNSMGGYDIFRSRLDTTTGLWGKPENLDFAINTPFDDLLFVTDKSKHFAFFASNRSSSGEQVTVYKVRIDTRPEKTQEITLQPLLAGQESEKATYEQSLAIIREMSKLSVNSSSDFQPVSTLPTTSEEPLIAKAVKQETAEAPVQSLQQKMDQKILQKKESQARVDTAFAMVGSLERSLKAFVEVREKVQIAAEKVADKREASLAKAVVRDLERGEKVKRARLENARYRVGTMQQLVSTQKTDSADKSYRVFRQEIKAVDTLTDFAGKMLNDMKTVVYAPKGKPSVQQDFFSTDEFARIRKDSAFLLSFVAASTTGTEMGTVAMDNKLPEEVKEKQEARLDPAEKTEQKIEKPTISDQEVQEHPLVQVTEVILQQLERSQDSLKALKTRVVNEAGKPARTTQAAMMKALVKDFGDREKVLQTRLSQTRKRADSIQLLLSKGDVVEAEKVYQALAAKIKPTDTLSDYAGKLQSDLDVAMKPHATEKQADAIFFKAESLAKTKQDTTFLISLVANSSGSASVKETRTEPMVAIVNQKEIPGEQDPSLPDKNKIESQQTTEKEADTKNDSIRAGDKPVAKAAISDAVVAEKSKKVDSNSTEKQGDTKNESIGAVEKQNDKSQGTNLSIKPGNDIARDSVQNSIAEKEKPASSPLLEGKMELKEAIAEERTRLEAQRQNLSINQSTNLFQIQQNLDQASQKVAAFQQISTKKTGKNESLKERETILKTLQDEAILSTARASAMSSFQDVLNSEEVAVNKQIEMLDSVGLMVSQAGNLKELKSIEQGFEILKKQDAQTINPIPGTQELQSLVEAKSAALQTTAKVAVVEASGKYEESILLDSLSQVLLSAAGGTQSAVNKKDVANSIKSLKAASIKAGIASAAAMDRYRANAFFDEKLRETANATGLQQESAPADIDPTTNGLKEETIKGRLKELHDNVMTLSPLAASLRLEKNTLEINKRLTEIQSEITINPLISENQENRSAAPENRPTVFEQAIAKDSIRQHFGQQYAQEIAMSRKISGNVQQNTSQQAQIEKREATPPVNVQQEAELRSSNETLSRNISEGVKQIDRLMDGEISVETEHLILAKLNDYSKIADTALLRLVAEIQAQQHKDGSASDIVMFLELKEFEIRASRNRSVYLANKLKSSELSRKAGDIALLGSASLMESEADIFFSQAWLLRDSAETSGAFLVQKSLFREAAGLEDTAIVKQFKAIALREKALAEMEANPPITKNERPIQPAGPEKSSPPIAKAHDKPKKKQENPISPVLNKKENQSPSKTIGSEAKSEIISAESPILIDKTRNDNSKTADIKENIRNTNKEIPVTDKISENIVNNDKVTKGNQKKENQNSPVAISKNDKVEKPTTEVKPIQSNAVVTAGKLNVLPELVYTAADTATMREEARRLIRDLPQSSQSMAEKVVKAVRELSLPEINGLYYTVQVGVYATPRSSAQLKGVSPLLEDRMNNGHYRYFYGIYGSKEAAVRAKNQVITMGIPDAFIVAMYKGRKLSLAEAKAYEPQLITNQIKETELVALVKVSTVSNGKPELRVQLGAFRKPLTKALLTEFAAKAGGELKTQLSATGLTLVFSPAYENYEAALEAKAKIVVAGIKDAFLVGFIGEERTSATRVRPLLKTARP